MLKIGHRVSTLSSSKVAFESVTISSNSRMEIVSCNVSSRIYVTAIAISILVGAVSSHTAPLSHRQSQSSSVGFASFSLINSKRYKQPSKDSGHCQSQDLSNFDKQKSAHLPLHSTVHEECTHESKLVIKNKKTESRRQRLRRVRKRRRTNRLRHEAKCTNSVGLNSPKSKDLINAVSINDIPGFVLNDANYVSKNIFNGKRWIWPQTASHLDLSTKLRTKSIPPLPSSLFVKSNSTESSSSSLYSYTNDDCSIIYPSNIQKRSLLDFKKRENPLTDEEYQRAKLEWAAQYTSLPTLRIKFGTNRNKLWGDFDPVTTRKLYHTLLPRAILGLYEKGIWSPKDLAPLAYEARVSAKKYARERSHLPGRVVAMVYDGFRSWRDWGTWNVEGMSWEQIWYKYEAQILDEMYEEGGTQRYQEHEFQEEIVAQICLRILERSCITSKLFDGVLLQGDKNVSIMKNKKIPRKSIRKRKKMISAEQAVAHVTAKLERDMQELRSMSEISTSSLSILNTGETERVEDIHRASAA